jgi:hypothetical protein
MKMNKMKRETGSSSEVINVRRALEEINERIVSELRLQLLAQVDEPDFRAQIISIDSREGILEISNGPLNLLNKDDIVLLNNEDSQRPSTEAVCQVLEINRDNINAMLRVVNKKFNLFRFRRGDFVNVNVIGLADGCPAKAARIVIAYEPADAVEAVEVDLTEEATSGGIESLMGVSPEEEVIAGTPLPEAWPDILPEAWPDILDADGDSRVTTSEIAEFVEAVNKPEGINVVDLGATMEEAKFVIEEAKFVSSIPEYMSSTSICANASAEVIAVPAAPGAPAVPVELPEETRATISGTARLQAEFYVDVPTARALLEAAKATRATLIDDVPSVIVYNHDGERGFVEPYITMCDDMERLIFDIEVRENFVAILSEEVRDEETFRELREAFRNTVDLPKLMITACVKMTAESGDVWPLYVIEGIRRIRKRPVATTSSNRGGDVKGVKGVKGCNDKCKKYYRLMCSKGGDSTRSGVFQGRMHIERQYMDIFAVVDAIGERLGFITGAVDSA